MHFGYVKCDAIDLGSRRQEGYPGESMPFGSLEVVEVMSWRDLDGARAEFPIDQYRVPNDRNRTVGQRKLCLLPDQPVVALVFGMDGDGGVAQHRLGPRGGDGQGGARIIRQRIEDVVHLASDVFVLDFDVGQRGEAAGAPVDEPLASINETVLVKADEDLAD